MSAHHKRRTTLNANVKKVQNSLQISKNARMNVQMPPVERLEETTCDSAFEWLEVVSTSVDFLMFLHVDKAQWKTFDVNPIKRDECWSIMRNQETVGSWTAWYISEYLM